MGPLDEGRVLCVLPDAAEARAIVERALGLTWRSRADLVGVQGARAGSGRVDGEFWQSGEWFLKSRGPRRFDALPAARAAAERLHEVKRRLGELTPARSVLVVVARPGLGLQLWTLAPALITLRERLDRAAAAAAWGEFARALTAFASGLGETLATSVELGLGLDANPANFATQGARLRYLDDDVAATHDALGVEDAFVARFAEYPLAPAPVWDAYVRRMADELRARAPATTRVRLGLDRRLRAAATLRRGAPAHVERLFDALERGP